MPESVDASVGGVLHLRQLSERHPCPDLPAGIDAKPNDGRLLARDLATLAKFIDVYCRGHHPHRQPVAMNGFDLERIAGKPLFLCPECTKLLKHALVKRSLCPWDPKPQCKHCPKHCYAPVYQRQIRQVMKFSGRRMVLRGRLDYLWHLFF